jgi:sortase (surface protein transpeptidase)
MQARSYGRKAGWLTCVRLAGLASALALAIAGCSGGSDLSATQASSPVPPAHSRSTAPVGAAPGVAPMDRSTPVRLRVPAIGITSLLMDLGVAGDGTLEVPPGAYPAGWFTGSPTPGEVGPAVIAGHVSYNGVDGVFYDLHSLRPADKVIVRRSDGSVAIFRVTRVAQYAKTRFPSAVVYGDIDHAGLRLITCGGFDSGTDSYRTNVVVFADLEAERGR